MQTKINVNDSSNSYVCVLEFDIILNKLEEYCYTEHAKLKCRELKPYLSEKEVAVGLRETSYSRQILDSMGTPPMVSMKDVDQLLTTAKQGGLLLPEQLEYLGITLTAIKRLKDFLNRCKQLNNSLAYYSDDLEALEEIRGEIQRQIRGSFVDDYASNALRDIRRAIEQLETKIRSKAEGMLRSNKTYCSDTFISNRNGHLCVPVKKEYKFKISGSVIDQSATGATLFIEPAAIAKMNEELQLLKIDEENEERRILYILTDLIAGVDTVFERNSRIIEKLDFIFAKGKLSAEMNGKAPCINTERYINIKQGRHPLLDQEGCVPLDFGIGDGIRGIVITGPNTGGKTVAIKTVGLLSLMAQSGLHIPCEEADICMNSQILCDIGDGQNITENLSTFSAHIKNILNILCRINDESMVILDELGSGTDPAEGMGIAIAILEELKKSNCLFIATTHYPEVKQYAAKSEDIINARMSFDRDTLKPLYQLEIGRAGESCALHIAKQLGMPNEMINRAYKEAYGIGGKETDVPIIPEIEQESPPSYKLAAPRIEKQEEVKKVVKRYEKFNIGDSVLVYPEKKIGIICRKSNDRGEILVQMQKSKRLVNHKRLKLHIAAEELYPEDYDFSIIFDSVANRKARHKMGKSYHPELETYLEE